IAVNQSCVKTLRCFCCREQVFCDSKFTRLNGFFEFLEIFFSLVGVQLSKLSYSFCKSIAFSDVSTNDCTLVCFRMCLCKNTGTILCINHKELLVQGSDIGRYFFVSQLPEV